MQALRNQLNSQRQLEAERALESTELLAENSADLPKDIVAQFKINRELSAALNQQAQRMDPLPRNSASHQPDVTGSAGAEYAA